MKKSTILDIFNGVRGQRDSIKLSEKNKKILVKVNESYGELEEKLSPELLKLHQKFVETLETCFSEDIDSYFIEGFKLGLLIGVECTEY